jgi:hypothetical protein
VSAVVTASAEHRRVARTLDVPRGGGSLKIDRVVSIEQCVDDITSVTKASTQSRARVHQTEPEREAHAVPAFS